MFVNLKQQRKEETIMKKILSILCAGLLMCGIGLTSCENHDEPVTGNAYGNNSIPEGRTISIAALKEKYNDFIDTSVDTYTTIEEETRIEGVIIGDDESGNIYKQLVVGDETGAIIIGVNATGLYACCPIGQKVVIDCTGLQIGSYRRLAQIGSLYAGKIGRMPEYVWKQHVRLINEPQLFYDELRPLEVSTAAELSAVDMTQAPLLVTLKNVSFPDANGTATYASEEDLSNSSLSFVERSINYADGSKSAVVAHTSLYANFSKEPLPQGTLNVTGVLTRYNNAWQLIIRTVNDVKRNK